MQRDIKKILCPIDLTAESEGTLSNALTFAKKFYAKLFVCYCISEQSSTLNSKELQDLNDFAKRTVDFFVSQETADTKIEWESVVVENNDVVSGIINAAQCKNADLIIINSNNHPLLHTLLWSIVEDVCRAAPCPVLVVHSPKPEDEKSSIKRILAAYDFSDYSELALQNAIILAQKFNAELHLLNVISETSHHEPENIWRDNTVNFLYHQTNERLQKALPNVRNNIQKLTTSICWGKPYREILAYIKERDIDLIAIGAQGADFGSKSLFGSNVDRVLRQAPCAVLVARPFKPIVNKNEEINCQSLSKF